MHFSSRGATALAAAASLAIPMLAGTAAQASHISGMKITVTNVNPISREVDIDLTILTLHGPAATSSNQAVGSPGVQWGDGSTSATVLLYGDPTATFPGAPANSGIYRGSLTHTYGDSQDYTIRATTVCCAVYDPGDIVTGYFESQSPGVYPYGVIVDTATAGLAWSQTFTGVSSCGLGGELALILPPLIFWRERRRRGA